MLRRGVGDVVEVGSLTDLSDTDGYNLITVSYDELDSEGRRLLDDDVTFVLVDCGDVGAGVADPSSGPP